MPKVRSISKNKTTVLDVKTIFSNLWLLLPVFTAVFAELLFFFRITVAEGRPPMTADSGIFQQVGWAFMDGTRLYVDAWAPNPPLSFETTWLLAVISGGSVHVHHVLNVLLMMGSACGIVALVTLLTRNLTGDRYAGAVAGFSTLLLPGFLVRPMYGFTAKYMALLIGLLSIYFAQQNKPTASGVAAGASVGYWQGAILFPVVTLGMMVHRRDWYAFSSVYAGSILAIVCLLAPVALLWDSMPEMLTQTVLVPFVLRGQSTVVSHFIGGVFHFKWASPLVLVGAYGILRITEAIFVAEKTRYSLENVWVVLGVGWFGFMAPFVDFEVGGYTDYIPVLAFLAVGIGIAVSRLSATLPRRLVSLAIAVVVVVNVVSLGSLGLVFTPVETPENVSMAELELNDRAFESPHVQPIPDARYIYWNEAEPTRCHYRLSDVELRWFDRTDGAAGSQCLGLESALDALD
jgi:hypothetical protein